MNDALREKLHKLPELPGCYLMRDADGAVIYVGKAVNLRNRVRSYFHGAHDPKTELLVENIADFDTVVVGSEAEALILEANLIKEHAPHYNILMRDDKHYPYLRVTLEEDFPRLLVARRAKNDGSKYFGPYPAVGGMRRAIELLRDVFPLRSCAGARFRPHQRACLNAHIGRCLAPCEGGVSPGAYRAMVEQLLQFLQGRTGALLKEEQAAMELASAELRFEDAARHRDRMQTLTALTTRQYLDSGLGEGDHDILAVAAGEDQAVVQLFLIRRGTVVNREHFFLTNARPGEEALLLQRFVLDYYGGGQMIPRDLYCNAQPEESELTASLLAESAGHKVVFSVPRRGDKKRLLDLAAANAQLILDNYLQSRQRQEQKNAAGLDALRLHLGLQHTPRRLECYDISHIQGSHMVGSMAVFINGAPAPKLYRRFRIKTLDQSNDFAALQEVLERRWQRGLEEKAQGKEPPDFSDFPDLVVIDGGKGQLSAVVERLGQIGARPVAIVSLAKEHEEVFLPGKSAPLRLPETDEGRLLLQRVRDEAHRFAVAYHRELRGKGQVDSMLDQAPGVGRERRHSLLKCFGSLSKIRAASLDELAAAPKMNRRAAEQLYAYLHGQEAGKE